MISGNKTHSREGFWPPDSSGKPEGPPTLGQLITSISLFNTFPTLTAQTLTAGQHHQPTQLCSACLDVGGRVTRWDHSSSRCLYKQQISYPTNSHTSRSPLNHGPGTGLFAPLFKNTGQGNAQTSELWKAESFIYIPLCSSNGLPWWLSGKEAACSAGNVSVILGSGRSAGGRNGNPFKCSCLENSTDRGAWWATTHEVAKIWTQLSN